jgi:hypothetical protein
LRRSRDGSTPELRGEGRAGYTKGSERASRASLALRRRAMRVWLNGAAK